MARRRSRILWFLIRSCAAVLIVTVALVLPLRWFRPVTTSFMIQNWLSQMSISANIRYQWVPRSAISRQAALAVMASEDQKFFEHPGFDLAAMSKVLRRANGRLPRRGASTISQQVAKNLFLWPGRSLVRKGIEAYLTVWIELLWPKERILEVYLNVAQFGPQLFGVEAASRDYFRKSAAGLGRPEAALLAAVLPNPKRLRVDRPTGYVRHRQNWIEWQAAHLAAEFPTAAWEQVQER